MHPPRALVVLVSLAIVAPAASIVAQQAATLAPSKSAILVAARTIIGKARYATLTTLDERGAPQARIVDPFPPEDVLTIWVATNSRSRKVGHIARDARVTLTYFDRDAQHYATVSGQAALVRDLAARAKRWKEEWASFYQDGHRGDDYLLIRVDPIRVEVVAPEFGMKNDPTTWRPIVLDLRAAPPGRQ